jgi:hypothetical protein
MLYRLTISVLSTAMLLGGAVTGLAQNWRHGDERGAFRANMGAQARVVRDNDRGHWRGGEHWRGDRDWGRHDFDRSHGYYWGGRGDHWGAYGYVGPRYYYSPGPYYYTPAPGYVYQAPSYYYYYPYGYAYYPDYGNGINLDLQFGGD